MTNDSTNDQTKSLLSKVKRAKSMTSVDKLKVLITGATKQGKSFICATSGKTPLIGLTELQAVVTIKRANPEACIFEIKTMRDIVDFLTLASSGDATKHFDAICLDGITDAQRIIRAHYTNQQGERAGKTKTSQETWGIIIDATAKLARNLRDIENNVIVTALDKEDTVEGIGIVHRPSLSGKNLPNDIGQYFNAVGFISSIRRENGLRREVFFRADEHYLVGGPEFLDDIEMPSFRWWSSKMHASQPSDDLKAEHDAWMAIDQPKDEKNDDNTNNE